jgi:hypothetical protein
MATLQSPGVAVTVINESFYTPAAPGTVPLIFVASASDKVNPSGITAVGTQAANAGKVYLVTSQRDLVDTFGTPRFYTDAGGNPIHGGELNEYGLQAAYSLLGVSSAAYVIRSPIDLAGLVASSSAPAGNPTNGSYWLDTDASLYGVFEWNKATSSFTNKVPAIIDDTNAALTYDGTAPRANFGAIGQYCMAVNQASELSNDQEVVTLFYKNSDTNWVEVGSRGETAFVSTGSNGTFISTTWSTSFPAVAGSRTFTSITTASSQTLTINGLTVDVDNGDTPADIALNINSTPGMFVQQGVGARVVNGALSLYVDAAKSESIIINGTGNILTQMGIPASTYNAPTVFVGPHTQYPNFGSEPTGSVYVKTTNPNTGANWTVKQWSEAQNAFNTVRAPIYADTSAATFNLDKTGGGANIPVGTLFVESNFTHGNDSTSTSAVLANFRVLRRSAVAPTTITGSTGTQAIVTAGQLKIEISAPGATGYAATATLAISSGTVARTELITKIMGSSLAPLGLTAETNPNGDGSVVIKHATGGEIRFTDPTGYLALAGFGTATSNFYSLVSAIEPGLATHLASNWAPLAFTASALAPSTSPANGQLWYNSIVDQVDILVHDGSEWKGYASVYPNSDPEGPIVSATRPTTQSDGTDLVNGDVWVSTADIERYGQDIYVYDGNLLQWVLQDPADNTSPNGWIFADARWADSGSKTAASTIKELRVSNYVDPDAPDPALYPRGMKLWNLRRSGFNVKRFVTDYINLNANDGFNLRYTPGGTPEEMTTYSANRWVSVSPNNADGSGTFGRKAQRSFVVTALKSTMDSNQSIRDTDSLTFNLIATPGYPELIQNMIALNVDRGLTAFVVGDTSMRLQPTGTAIQAYGLNTNGAFDNGDIGLVSYNEYMAVFYPSGFTNDLTGNNIVVPPSHMMLRTIALSDQQSYPWFAPAGIRRGVIDNATSVGYLQDGEFRSTALPQNVRDVMASAKINPIATITGAGIINFGQYTRANAASSLDRINVARLVAYLRRQLDVLARPFLFEPNDKVTRNEIRNAVQNLLLELVGQRALYDFIVVCDESNNTPARIDRSELWVDVAIEPVKAVEFIYIPVRLVNTGEIKAGTFTIA